MMDPMATLQAAVQAMRRDERNEAVTALRDLVDWIERGGFMPYASVVDAAEAW